MARIQSGRDGLYGVLEGWKGDDAPRRVGGWMAWTHRPGEHDDRALMTRDEFDDRLLGRRRSEVGGN